MEEENKNEGEQTYAALLSNIADKLMKVQLELDDLVLQFAVGKAGALDEFEKAKKQLSDRVSEFQKTKLGEVSDATQKLKGLLEELELQLNLGKAESKDKFLQQRRKIESVIAKVRKELKQTNLAFDKDHMEHEIEIFRLKLEILRLRFEVRKFEAKDSFKEGMQEARRKIEKTALKLRTQLTSERSVVDKLRKEATGAYRHLRKTMECI